MLRPGRQIRLMNRLTKSLALLALAGHLLTAWAGPWLHDHGHALGECAGEACGDSGEPQRHHCCHHHHHGHSHKHAAKPASEGSTKSPAGPCHHAPGEDPTCPACQVLANAPHPVQPVVLPTSGEPLAEPVATVRPRLGIAPVRIDRSRAPPTV
jgi:hypothetical protein